jgi:protein ImuB
LFDLSLIQLENRDLPFEVDTLSLNCHAAMPVQARSHTLDFDLGRKINRHSFSITAAKLKARLGDASVYKLSYCDGYLPQDTNQRILLTEQSKQDLPEIHQRAQRPNWLLDSPSLIDVRKQGLYWRGRIRLIAGPERIQGNWWREPSARDYFIGLRQDQQRLWIFLDLHKQQWFVQGIFA